MKNHMESLENPELTMILKDGLDMASRRKEGHLRSKGLCDREKGMERLGEDQAI